MTSFLQTWDEAAMLPLGFFYCCGLRASIQVFVNQERMRRTMGDADQRRRQRCADPDTGRHRIAVGAGTDDSADIVLVGRIRATSQPSSNLPARPTTSGGSSAITPSRFSPRPACSLRSAFCSRRLWVRCCCCPQFLSRSMRGFCPFNKATRSMHRMFSRDGDLAELLFPQALRVGLCLATLGERPTWHL